MPVQFILGGFANIGYIPEFKCMIATNKSRLMSFIMMLETQEQLKEIYGEDADVVISNCDSIIVLGCRENKGESMIDRIDVQKDYNRRGGIKNWLMGIIAKLKSQRNRSE